MSKEIFDKKTILRDTILAIVAGVVGIIIVSFFTHNFNFVELVKSFRLSYILWAFVLIFLSWLIEAYTIKLVGEILGYKIPLKEALRIFLIGGFFSRITPFGGGGGEPIQMIILSKEKSIPAGDSAAIISIKMFIGTFVRVSVFILVPIWILVAKPTWGISRGVNILINTGVAITLILFSFLLLVILKPEFVELLVKKALQTKFVKKFVKEKAQDRVLAWTKKTVNEYKLAKDKIVFLNRATVYFIFFLSFISWGLVLFTPVMLMRGLGVTSPWPEIVITAIIFYISSTYIPTPGGSGAAEIGIFALFARLIPNPLIGTFIIVWRFFTHYLLLIIGGIATFFDSFKKLKTHK